MEKIIELIKKVTYCYKEDILNELSNPNWEQKSRCHNWRTYVPEEVRKEWDNLDLEFRAGIYLLAQCEAEREEWD